jgi:hypothetical protein
MAQPDNPAAASARQRLLSLARESGTDYNALLVQFTMERALHLLSISRHADQFILKGAMLFRLWDDDAARSTMDVDLLGRQTGSMDEMKEVFREVLSAGDTAVAIRFLVDELTAVEIRGAQEYGGVRVVCPALLGTARLRAQFDVGFGDAVTPGPVPSRLKCLLGLPDIPFDAYPPETVVAEKLEAVVRLGLINTRIKDFYDLWVLSQRLSADSTVMARAVQATFARRNTPLPTSTPVGLTGAFATTPGRSGQWTAFLSRMDTPVAPVNFSEVIASLGEHYRLALGLGQP